MSGSSRYTADSYIIMCTNNSTQIKLCVSENKPTCYYQFGYQGQRLRLDTSVCERTK